MELPYAAEAELDISVPELEAFCIILNRFIDIF